MVSITLHGTASVKNTGSTVIGTLILGFSIYNQETSTWYDLPWKKSSNVAVGSVVSYSLTGQFDIPIGTYDVRLGLWSGSSGGSAVPGESGYYSGGTLSGPLKMLNIPASFSIIEPTTSVEILSASVLKLA